MYKVLELDGGGIRSLFSAYVFSGLPHIDYDLIIGTSAGAIDACLLASDYDKKEIIDFYMGECGKKIFKPYLFPINKSKYNPKNLESVLLEKLGDRKLKDCKQKIAIPVYDIKARKVILFNNLTDKYGDLYLRDIARASSAAPFYFTPYEFGEYRCVDGGLAMNNGTLGAYSKLKRLKLINGVDDVMVVSIGTGSFETPLSVNDMTIINPAKFVTNLIDCFMDANADTVELEAGDILEDRYFRFQTKINKENTALDNVSDKNLISLIKLANDALNGELKFEIERLNDFIGNI